MKGYIKREDDFTQRRKHLANLSDEELKQRFWELAEKSVEPLLELARTLHL
jgi:D-ornithine 4,5-aminomutase subunit alpha